MTQAKPERTLQLLRDDEAQAKAAGAPAKRSFWRIHESFPK